jgi:large subunit ribosomal protein L9
MQVLLREDVQELGRMGDVVDVANGYARNYLLPKKIAVPVTPDNLSQLESVRQARRQREEEEMARVSRQAELLEGFLCYIQARATEKGHLFGSVDQHDIAEQLAESGFEGIRAANISLARPIQEIGDCEVEIMLHPEVRATITIRVAGEEEED